MWIPNTNIYGVTSYHKDGTHKDKEAAILESKAQVRVEDCIDTSHQVRGNSSKLALNRSLEELRINCDDIRTDLQNFPTGHRQRRISSVILDRYQVDDSQVAITVGMKRLRPWKEILSNI